MPEPTDFHAIYLYYFLSGGTARLYEWWDPNEAIKDEDDLKDKIKKLTRNAFKNEQDPPYLTDIQDFMLMRRRSYVVFALNRDSWEGNTYEVSMKQYDNSNGSIQTDHTFKKKTHYETGLTWLGSHKHAIICYENLMTRTDSKPWDHKEREKFEFRLPFVGKVPGRAPDSGGTNMGPPVPPPAGIYLPKVAGLS